MSDVYSDSYWRDEFQVTQADLDRLAGRIRETGQAQDLMTLARRVVRGRLVYGPEASAPALVAWAKDPSVRLWDPARKWKRGEHAVVTHVLRKDMYDVHVAEVVAVEDSQVRLKLPGIEAPVPYLTALPGSQHAIDWCDHVRRVVAEKQQSPEREQQADAVLLSHPERVPSQVDQALRADARFVTTGDRWFLRELTMVPTDEQLAALAWAMLPLSEPLPTEQLAPMVQPPLPAGDPGLFGLHLALREHPDLFANADPGQHPRWRLNGPPPGSVDAVCAAYDPESYEVLCVPGQPLPPDDARRLWELGLLQAVVEAA